MIAKKFAVAMAAVLLACFVSESAPAATPDYQAAVIKKLKKEIATKGTLLNRFKAKVSSLAAATVSIHGMGIHNPGTGGGSEKRFHASNIAMKGGKGWAMGYIKRTKNNQLRVRVTSVRRPGYRAIGH